MRTYTRINEMLSLIKEIWEQHPDLRFNQLIYILQNEFSATHSNEGKISAPGSDGFDRIGFDLFNVEDDLFLDFLRSKCSDN